MLQFQQYLFHAFFSTNDIMCRFRYDIIYHPSTLHQFSIFEDVGGLTALCYRFLKFMLRSNLLYSVFLYDWLSQTGL